MKSIIVIYAPTEKAALKGVVSKTYPYQVGQPLPEIGERVTFGDPFKPYKVVSRSFHYATEDDLQVFFGIDSAIAA